MTRSERDRCWRRAAQLSRPAAAGIGDRRSPTGGPFCATDPADTAGRADLLAAIFGRVERGVHIEPPFYAEYGVHTSIGEDTFWLGAGVIVLTGVIVGEPGASGEDGGEAQQSRSLPSNVVAELPVQARDVRVEVN